MRKWVFRFCFLGAFLFGFFLLSLYFFPHFYIKLLTLRSLHSFCHEQLHAPLSYKSCTWKGNQLILSNIEIGERGEGCHIETATFRPFLRWKKRSLGGELHLQGMLLMLAQKKTENLLVGTFLDRLGTSTLPFFKLNLHIKVKKGRLICSDHEKQLCGLDWELEYWLSQRKSFGKVDIDLDPKSPLLHLEFTQTEEGTLHLVSRIDTHPIAPLIETVQLLFPASLQNPSYNWICEKGKVEGAIDTTFSKGEISHVLGKLSLSQCGAKNEILGLHANIDHLFASLDLDFASPKSVESWNGHFLIKGGQLAKSSHRHLIWKEMWELNDLASEIVVKKGKVCSSSFFATLMGMEGELEFNWHSPQELMHMSFSGNADKISSFIPEKYQEGFAIAFPDDHFEVEASLAREKSGLNLKGQVKVISSNSAENTLDFGCILGGGSKNTTPVFQEQDSILIRSVDWMVESLKSQFCLSSKTGWFSAKALPLDKFLAPFLLGRVNMELTGQADVDASFDDSFLVISYQGEEICLESPHFCIDAPKIAELEGKSAVHYVNLDTWEHIGFLPLDDFAYTQKNFGIHFPKASGVVRFENHSIRLENIKTTWDKLAMNGNVTIEIHNLKSVDLGLSIDKADGPIDCVQGFLSKISKSRFWEIPVEGEIECGKGDIFFGYHFTPQATLQKGIIAGKLKANFKADEIFDGDFSLELADCISHFHFDATRKELSFVQGEGLLNGADPIVIRANSLLLFNLPDFDLDCDLIAIQKHREIGRIALKTKTKEGKKIIHVDQTKSYFGKSCCQVKRCEIIDWKKVEAFDATFKTSLSDLFSLLYWGGGHLPFLEKDVMEKLCHEKRLNAEIESSLVFQDGELSFQLSSEHVTMDNISLGKLACEGSLESCHMCIDHFSLGFIEVMGDFFQHSWGWEIPFLGIRMSELGHVALEGDFQKSQRRLECRISDFSVDLSGISDLGFLSSTLQKKLKSWRLKGKFGGEGWLVCTQGKPFHFKAETLASFERLHIGGVELGEGENLSCCLSSEKGLTIEGLKVEIGKPGDILPPISYKIGKCGFNLASSTLTFEGFDFSFPVQRLPWMSHLLMQLIPGQLSPAFPAYIEGLKKKEPLEGSLSFEIGPKQHWVHLTLKDGTYFLKERSIKLSDFSCIFDPKGLLCQSKTKIGDTPLWLHLRSNDMNLSKGILTLTEPSIQEWEKEHTLNVLWYKNRNSVFEVEQIKGALRGITISLMHEKSREEDKKIRLFGKVILTAPKQLVFFPRTLQEVFEKGGVGGGYQLYGHFSVNRNKFSDLFFSGTLGGKEFEIGGMTLLSMGADLSFSPKRVEFKNLEIKDRGGNLSIEEMVLLKEQENWVFNVPFARLLRLRPARLRASWTQERKKPKKNFQSFLIHSFELSHFNGILGKQETFRGEGSFLFSNYPKKGLVSNILLIPYDIIARIGLDFALLVPVRGKIWYQIDQKKILLRRCEEMYSDRKRSRFFLSKDVPSYVDFKGNLDINLKMKQYNLLMKFVELLTMNVSGTLTKPSYHLFTHKEKRDSQISNY